jgi:hypothetical protein
MKRLLSVVLLLNTLFVFAGGTVKVKGHKFIILPFVTVTSQKPVYGQLDIGHVFPIHYDNRHPYITVLAYSKLGGEFNFNFKHKIWAPEFSSEIDLGFICLRGNIADYFESGQHKFYYMPEAGLTFNGYITVVAGYNRPFDSGFSDIAPYRLSINWMLPFNISGSSKYKQK